MIFKNSEYLGHVKRRYFDLPIPLLVKEGARGEFDDTP